MAQQDADRGERIAELRKAAGYSSAARLAAALDVNYRTVQNWEAGLGMREENVLQLAELLKVPREFILYGPNETPDLIGAVNGSDELRRQLNRIEDKLDALLATVTPEAEILPPLPAALKPAATSRPRKHPAPARPAKKRAAARRTSS